MRREIQFHKMCKTVQRRGGEMSFLESCLRMTLKFTSQPHGDAGQKGTSLLMKNTTAKPPGFGRSSPAGRGCAVPHPPPWFSCLFPNLEMKFEMILVRKEYKSISLL